MKGKINKALIVVIALSLMVVGVAYAEEDTPDSRIRAVGEITSVDLDTSTFGLHAHSGDDLRFKVIRSTNFRSPNGTVKELSDLEVGMRAFVIGIEEDDGLTASVVVAAKPGDIPERIHVVGEITGVASASGSFSLEKGDGEVVTFQTNERTRFRSRDGSIQGVEDLETGMYAMVIAVEQEDGGLLALIVAAGYKEDLPDNLKRFKGEITSVVPEQGTFTIATQEGITVTIHTHDQTRFRSRDGSISGIHDLGEGMKAFVGATEQEDGTLLAIVVAAWQPQDPSERPGVFVRGKGRIVSLGDRSFTIETQDGERMTFSVDDSTRYRSRDGSVNRFDDLQVGMMTLVGAKKLENGQLKAVWVGAGKPQAERPERDSNRPSERLSSVVNEPTTP